MRSRAMPVQPWAQDQSCLRKSILDQTGLWMSSFLFMPPLCMPSSGDAPWLWCP